LAAYSPRVTQAVIYNGLGNTRATFGRTDAADYLTEIDDVGFIVGEPVDLADDAVGNLRTILIGGRPLPIDG
jgi:hypothetical protein